MRIALTHSLRRQETEDQSEMYRPDEIERLVDAITSLGHTVSPVEVTVSADEIVDRLIDVRPELIFNVAEGSTDLGPAREAFFPSIFEMLGIPYVGGGPALLYVDMDKRLTEKLMDIRGLKVPKGVLLTREHHELPDDLPMPVFVKPNYEGTSKGISQQSVVENRQNAQKLIDQLLEEYPSGVEVEQYIAGRELTVPFLESWPGQLLDIVEHDFSGARGDHDIYDYELKQTDEGVKFICPAELDEDERAAVLDAASRALQVLPTPDFGRVDFRLAEDGTPYLLEINPLPRLMPDGSLIIAAETLGISYEGVMDMVIRSASARFRLSLGAAAVAAAETERRTCREYGVEVGRLPTGPHNAITDVEGVHVGHVTHEVDGVPDPDKPDATTSLRTGITAIVPESTDLFNNHLPAGGFILNGVGEVSGITQAMEWGWLETPILLTNTMSTGLVHTGMIQHMIDKHPELGRKVDVIIPLVAETDDSFLNDVRILANTPERAIEAIEKAKGGPVEQGSIGGGTGMMTFDFAGGIGTSSRVLPDGDGDGGWTIGVLVQSNFGKMRNLTIDGSVIGRRLDPLFPEEIRRGESYGSIIVVIATDAPLLPAQLSRLSKRAALGLGRVGSFAAATSGEIIFAFSTGNRASRVAKEQSKLLSMEFLTDPHINPLYEAVIECTEEAVLNAIFCSRGQTGRLDRVAPPLPVEQVLAFLGKRCGPR